jgi:hypothetical protein
VEHDTASRGLPMVPLGNMRPCATHIAAHSLFIAMRDARRIIVVAPKDHTPTIGRAHDVETNLATNRLSTGSGERYIQPGEGLFQPHAR